MDDSKANYTVSIPRQLFVQEYRSLDILTANKIRQGLDPCRILADGTDPEGLPSPIDSLPFQKMVHKD